VSALAAQHHDPTVGIGGQLKKLFGGRRISNVATKPSTVTATSAVGDTSISS
jgi:hypothetical protein